MSGEPALGAAPSLVSVEQSFWRERRVLITGHTGFKGGWLALWLQSLGCPVGGLSVGAPTTPSLYGAAGIAQAMSYEVLADVRDPAAVDAAVDAFAPDIVFHLAAQPLVRRSYAEPRETYDVNVMGTVNVLDAVRKSPTVRVVVVVTTDKCYENRGWEWGYRETDPMGGHDPYSSSKGAAELVTAAYRSSFFRGDSDHRVAVATARAGNVLGGGDWAQERLVPDLVRARAARRPLAIRNPDAIRPWQHVLNPLSGYLLLAQQLWTDPQLATAWNFGPPDDDARSVAWIVEQLRERWGDGVGWEQEAAPQPHEATYLKLDSSRARARLGWRPPVTLERALHSIVAWHDAFDRKTDMRDFTQAQMRELLDVSP